MNFGSLIFIKIIKIIPKKIIENLSKNILENYD